MFMILGLKHMRYYYHLRKGKRTKTKDIKNGFHSREPKFVDLRQHFGGWEIGMIIKGGRTDSNVILLKRKTLFCSIRKV